MGDPMEALRQAIEKRRIDMEKKERGEIPAEPKISTAPPPKAKPQPEPQASNNSVVERLRKQREVVAQTDGDGGTSPQRKSTAAAQAGLFGPGKVASDDDDASPSKGDAKEEGAKESTPVVSIPIPKPKPPQPKPPPAGNPVMDAMA